MRHTRHSGLCGGAAFFFLFPNLIQNVDHVPRERIEHTDEVAQRSGDGSNHLTEQGVT
jgi:hypothetical protein